MSGQETAASENSDALIKRTHDAVVFSTTANGDGEISQMLSGEQPGVLETAAERRARRHSHWIVYITTFVMSIGFSIVLTGVWPYLQQLDTGVSKEFLGWVIAANPLGQMITSPLLGLWGNKSGSNRGAFLATVLLFIIGNILYSILNLFGSAAKGVMIFSRFLVGVSSANIAIIRSYISSSTTLKERTTAVALTSAAQGLGFIIGPAIQAALAVAFSFEKNDNKTLSMSEVLEEDLEDAGLWVEWNMYTATGWVATILGVMNFFLFLPCIFKEYPIAAKEAQLKRHDTEKDQKLPKPDYPALTGVLISFFIILFIYVLLETLLVPMCIDLYAWTNEKAITVVGVGLSIAGAVSIVMFALTSVLTRKFDERKVFIFLGLLPLTVSMFIHFPMGNTYPKMQNCTFYDGASELDTFTMLPDLNINFTEPSNILSRQRRHAARDGTCTDLGCPQVQEWCLYTPIIEKPQMAVADITAVIGYPVAFTLSSSFFSKILGPKPQGVWMGILTSTGSLSRVTGPIFVSYMYTALGTRWTFGILLVIMSLTLVIISLLFKRLVPMKIVAT